MPITVNGLIAGSAAANAAGAGVQQPAGKELATVKNADLGQARDVDDQRDKGK